jgi:benzodiazapine receptor
MNRLRTLLGLVAWVWVAMSGGLVGSQFGVGPWYDQLDKPWWTPPPVAFPIVWSALYVVMGVAAFLVWRRHGFNGARIALGLWFIQLALNAAWSWVFFGLQSPGAAFFEIILLWGAILSTFLAFRQRDRLAAILMLPYLVWVGFAFALNYTIWRMNP